MTTKLEEEEKMFAAKRWSIPSSNKNGSLYEAATKEQVGGWFNWTP